MSHSPLNEIIRAEVEEARGTLLNEVVEPWMFFNSHGVSIKKADGRPISYPGLEFTGTPKFVFWDGFIDDHIKKTSRQLIESTRLKAIEKNLPIEEALADCLMHIRNMIQMAFNRMSIIDQRLRGKGFPESVKRKDVTDRIERSYAEIQKLIYSEIQCINSVPRKSKNKWLHPLELKPNFFGLGVDLKKLFGKKG